MTEPSLADRIELAKKPFTTTDWRTLSQRVEQLQVLVRDLWAAFVEGEQLYGELAYYRSGEDDTLKARVAELEAVKKDLSAALSNRNSQLTASEQKRDELEARLAVPLPEDVKEMIAWCANRYAYEEANMLDRLARRVQALEQDKQELDCGAVNQVFFYR